MECHHQDIACGQSPRSSLVVGPSLGSGTCTPPRSGAPHSIQGPKCLAAQGLMSVLSIGGVPMPLGVQCSRRPGTEVGSSCPSTNGRSVAGSCTSPLPMSASNEITARLLGLVLAKLGHALGWTTAASVNVRISSVPAAWFWISGHSSGRDPSLNTHKKTRTIAAAMERSSLSCQQNTKVP